LLTSDGPADTKARLSWLKTQHGFGSTTARLIVDRVEGRGAEATDVQAYLAVATRYVEDMYSGAKVGLRPLHDALVRHALALGDDVKVSPRKTIVSLYRNHVFAEIKPATKTRVDFGLALKGVGRRVPQRLLETGGLEKGDRITHKIPVSDPAEIDGQLLEWLRLAYELDAGA